MLSWAIIIPSNITQVVHVMSSKSVWSRRMKTTLLQPHRDTQKRKFSPWAYSRDLIIEATFFVCFSEANFTTPWLGISAGSEETDEENASCRESAMIKLSNSLPQKAKKTDWRRSPRDAFHSRTRRNAEEERFDGNCMLGSVLLRRRHLNTQAVLREYECVSAHLR